MCQRRRVGTTNRGSNVLELEDPWRYLGLRLWLCHPVCRRPRRLWLRSVETMQCVLLNRGLDCRTGIQRYIRSEQRETVWTELIAKEKKGLHRVRLIDIWETPIRDSILPFKARSAEPELPNWWCLHYNFQRIHIPIMKDIKIQHKSKIKAKLLNQ